MGYKTSVVLLPCVCYPSAITLLNTSDPHCVAGGDTVAAPIVKRGNTAFGHCSVGFVGFHHFHGPPLQPHPWHRGDRSTPMQGGPFCAIPAPASRARSPAAATMRSVPRPPPQLPIRLRSLRCAHGPAAPITRGVAALSAGPDGGERHKGQRRSLRGAPLRALSPTRAELCAPAHLCSGRGAPRRPSSAPHLRPCAIYGAAPGAGSFRAAAVCLGKVSTGCSGPCFLLHRLFPPLCPALGLPSLAPTWWGSGQPGFVARCLVVRWGCGSCRLDCPPPSVPSVALICAGVGSGAGGMETLFGNESCLFGRRAAYEPQARVTPASL